MQEYVEPLVDLARTAGEKILEVYRRPDLAASATLKEDRSPLTEADLVSHQTIVRGLEELTPDIPILSEESKQIDYADRAGWRRFWLVDPLDGTKEFLKRNGEFTVNIALIDDGQPVLGVVFAPELQRCYWGGRGIPAMGQNGAESPRAIEVVSDPPTPEPLRVVASRSHMSQEVQDWLGALDREYECLSMGSSLKLCLVADGSAHCYPRLAPTMEWDTGAAHAVVDAAGGCVCDPEGRPLRYNKENLLNPFFIVHNGSTPR